MPVIHRVIRRFLPPLLLAMILAMVLTIVLALSFRLAGVERLAPVALAWLGVHHAAFDLAAWNGREIRINAVSATLDSPSGPIQLKVRDAACRYRLSRLFLGELEACEAAVIDVSLPEIGPVPPTDEAPFDPSPWLNQLRLRNLPAQSLRLHRVTIHRGPAAPNTQATFAVELTGGGQERRLRIDSIDATGATKNHPLSLRLQSTDDHIAGSLHLDLAGLAPLLPPSGRAAMPLQGKVEIELNAATNAATNAPLHLRCTIAGLRHPRFSAAEIALQLDSAQPLAADSPFRRLALAPASRLVVRNAASEGAVLGDFSADLTGTLNLDDKGWRLQLAPATPWKIEGLTLGAARFAPLLLNNLSLQLEANQTQLRASAAFAVPPMQGTIKADCNRQQSGEGQCSVRTEGALMIPEGGNPFRLLIAPTLPLAVEGGALTASAQSQWSGASPPDLQATIAFTDGHGTVFEAPFTGLTIRQQLRLWPVMESITPGLLELGQLQGPIPAEHLVVKTRLRPSAHGKGPNLLIDQAALQLFGGSLQLEDCVYDRNRPDSVCLLRIDNLDLQPLTALHQVEGLTVSGRVQGSLPLQFSPQGVSVRHGELANTAEGGIIRYRPTGSALAQSPLTAYAAQALEDLHYERLTAQVDYLPDGLLTIALQLQGKNPKLEGGRPVHLNIAAEQNLLSLLKSLQYSQSLSSELDRKIRNRH